MTATLALYPHDAETTALRELDVHELIEGARRFLDEDVQLARHYLERISALFAPAPASVRAAPTLLPERLPVSARAPKGGLAAWQMRKVLAHIDRHLAHTLSTEQLAGVARLSGGHFCRAFKASMGETPHGYIMRQRIRRAQILMLESRDSLSQIACACGLTDQAHLTRLFRRALGTTPMVWRRTWQGEV